MPRLVDDREYFAEPLAWNDYCDAVHRGIDTEIHWYRERYEQLVHERIQRTLREWNEQNANARRTPVEIILAPPRRLTSAAVARMITHGLYAALLPVSAVLCAITPLWAICIVAPLVIYIWWLVTGETIRAADQLDDHPIPPARLLSEGPR